MIEIMKLMFLGEVAYFSEMPPRRLRNNPLWSKEKVKVASDKLLEAYDGDYYKIIENMKGVRNNGIPAPRLA